MYIANDEVLAATLCIFYVHNHGYLYMILGASEHY